MPQFEVVSMPNIRTLSSSILPEENNVAETPSVAGENVDPVAEQVIGSNVTD